MRDPKHPRQFTEEFRRQIVALVDSGKPRAEVMREYDLVTYHEILSFWNGEDVDRDAEKRRREGLIPRWLKIVRAVGKMLIAMAIGAFVGYGGAALAHALLG